jgi:hypothetical protein
LVAAGLYELFVDDRAPVPGSLRVRNLDGLKHKLTPVVAALTYFLGSTRSGGGK